MGMTPDGGGIGDPWSCAMTPIPRNLNTQRSMNYQSSLTSKIKMAVEEAIYRGQLFRKDIHRYNNLPLEEEQIEVNMPDSVSVID